MVILMVVVMECIYGNCDSDCNGMTMEMVMDVVMVMAMATVEIEKVRVMKKVVAMSW